MCRAKGVSLFLDCGGCRCVNTDDSAFVYSILLIIRIKKHMGRLGQEFMELFYT